MCFVFIYERAKTHAVTPFWKWRGTGSSKHFLTCAVDSSMMGNCLASWPLAAVFLCWPISKEQSKVQVKIKNFNNNRLWRFWAKSQKGQDFKEAWRKEFDCLMYDNESGKMFCQWTFVWMVPAQKNLLLRKPLFTGCKNHRGLADLTSWISLRDGDRWEHLTMHVDFLVILYFKAIYITVDRYYGTDNFRSIIVHGRYM